jgi:hypothetical protein
MKLEEGILKFSDLSVDEFKFLIMGEIEREKSIKYRYPDSIESLVNFGLTVAFGIILGTDSLVDNEREFASAVIRRIEDKKKAISEEEDVIFIDTSYILLGMETACDIVNEMLNKINGD